MDELVPLRRNPDCAVGVGHSWRVYDGVAVLRERPGLVCFERVAIGLHHSSGFVVEVSNKHGRSFNIENTLAAGFELLQCRTIEGKRRLRRTCDGLGLGTTSTLPVAVERNSAIFCVNGSVVSQEQIASDESAATLHALERSLLGM